MIACLLLKRSREFGAIFEHGQRNIKRVITRTPKGSKDPREEHEGAGLGECACRVSATEALQQGLLAGVEASPHGTDGRATELPQRSDDGAARTGEG